MGKIITKRIQPTVTSRKLYNNGRQSSIKQVYRGQEQDSAKPIQNAVINKKMQEEKDRLAKENNDTLQENDSVMMDTNKKVELAAAILENEEGKVKAKRIRKEKGLIERKENTIILTEDNRELLKD